MAGAEAPVWSASTVVERFAADQVPNGVGDGGDGGGDGDGGAGAAVEGEGRRRPRRERRRSEPRPLLATRNQCGVRDGRSPRGGRRPSSRVRRAAGGRAPEWAGRRRGWRGWWGPEWAAAMAPAISEERAAGGHEVEEVVVVYLEEHAHQPARGCWICSTRGGAPR